MRFIYFFLLLFICFSVRAQFGPQQIISSEAQLARSVFAADINGNGHQDVVVSARVGDFHIAWFENLDGSGNFGPLKHAGSFEYVQTVDAQDMNGDGDIDIIAGGNYKISWLENIDGLGTFGPEKIISENAYTESINVNDIDGDGDMDIAMGDWTRDIVAWYENLDGQGNFGPEKVIASDAYGTNTVDVKDMDNDGDLDVISVSWNNYVGWYENLDGTGNFSAPHIISTTTDFVYKIEVADFNGDGYNDVLGSKFDNGEIVLWRNEENGNFAQTQVLYTNAGNPIGITSADFNGDSQMDAAAGIYISNQIVWFGNNGPLHIEENTTNLLTIYPNPTNGVLTINSTKTVSEITIYSNLGQLLFTEKEKNKVDISALNDGIYFIKIKNDKGQTETKKVAKI